MLVAAWGLVVVGDQSKRVQGDASCKMVVPYTLHVLAGLSRMMLVDSMPQTR